jgi:hypothetical protein
MVIPVWRLSLNTLKLLDLAEEGLML